jgi:hypothetical protein
MVRAIQLSSPLRSILTGWKLASRSTSTLVPSRSISSTW